MTIKVGDRLPDATLAESTSFGEFCPTAPENVSVAEAFARGAASRPPRAPQHVPGYLANHDALKAKKVDEIWCLATNDGFVMAAWGQAEKAMGKIRFLGDGSADFAKKLGLELDLPTKGMGMRMQRFSMLVEDGVVKQLNVEGPGKFEVSNAETMLQQLG